MKQKSVVTLTLLGALALSACAATEATAPAEESAAIVRPLSGSSELSAVTLIGKAAQRLGIETAPVRRTAGASKRTVVPYGALIYDPSGGTWTYTETKPMTYVREAVSVDRIVGSRALLSDGPPVGTPVVTVGAAELYGAEVGVDH